MSAQTQYNLLFLLPIKNSKMKVRNCIMLAKILCFIGGAAFGVAAMCVFITAGQDDERSGIK